MDGMGFSVIALEVVVFTIPGALFSIRVAERGWLSLRASVAGALAVFTVSLLFVFAFIHTRESAPGIFAVCPFIGFSNGWIYPAQRNLLVALMPGGAEAEMMGFFQFSSSIFSWAPALLFLAMSESLGSLRFAILVCPAFWLIGLATLLLGVDVEKGVAEVADTLHLRVHQDDGAGAGSKRAETELVVLDVTARDVGAGDSPRPSRRATRRPPISQTRDTPARRAVVRACACPPACSSRLLPSARVLPRAKCAREHTPVSGRAL